MALPARSLALAALLLVLGAGLAAAETPFVPGAERIQLEWERAERRGQPVVQGYAYNDSGFILGNVRVLVESLGTAGEVTARTFADLLGELGPFTRAFFQVSVPPAPAYRLSVFSLTRIESDSFR